MISVAFDNFNHNSGIALSTEAQATTQALLMNRIQQAESNAPEQAVNIALASHQAVDGENTELAAQMHQQENVQFERGTAIQLSGFIREQGEAIKVKESVQAAELLIKLMLPILNQQYQRLNDITESYFSDVAHLLNQSNPSLTILVTPNLISQIYLSSCNIGFFATPKDINANANAKLGNLYQINPDKISFNK